MLAPITAPPETNASKKALHLKDLNILRTGSCKTSEAYCQPCRENKVLQTLKQNFEFPSEVLLQMPQCNCQPFRADSPDTFRDYIVVSIDLGMSKEQTQLNDIGICTLDTRDLEISKQYPRSDTNKLLSTYILELHRFKEISKRFRYGEAE